MSPHKRDFITISISNLVRGGIFVIGTLPIGSKTTFDLLVYLSRIVVLSRVGNLVLRCFEIAMYEVKTFLFLYRFIDQVHRRV